MRLKTIYVLIQIYFYKFMGFCLSKTFKNIQKVVKRKGYNESQIDMETSMSKGTAL